MVERLFKTECAFRSGPGRRFALPRLGRRIRCGFTLIEVLVAIALVLALLGAMYGFLFDVLATRSRVLEHVRQETAASTLIKQLDADLATCIVGDRISGGGIVGSSRQIRVLSRHVSASLATRGVHDPNVFGDLQLAEYRFVPQHNQLEGRRGAFARHSTSALPFSPLEGVIHNVRFRYHDGQAWQGSFDSRAQNQLPVAIEVAMWYRPLSPPGVEEEEEEAANVLSDELAVDSSSADIEDGPAESLVLDEFVEQDERDWPPPDRVRVFIIPDAKVDSKDRASDSVEEAQGGEV